MSIEELRLLHKKMEEDINSTIVSHGNFVKKLRQDYEEVRNKFIKDNRKFPDGFRFLDWNNNEWEIRCDSFSEETGFEYGVQAVDKNWEGYYDQTYLTESEIEEFISQNVPQDTVENLILEKCNKLRFLFDEYVNSCKRIEEEFNEKINKLQK